jgi:hypothetical protein
MRDIADQRPAPRVLELVCLVGPDADQSVIG